MKLIRIGGPKYQIDEHGRLSKPKDGWPPISINEKSMTKFIKLPNGSLVGTDVIKAVRIEKGRPEANLKPQVIVDYIVGCSALSIAFDCENESEARLAVEAMGRGLNFANLWAF
jgi:hypothetical protein